MDPVNHPLTGRVRVTTAARVLSTKPQIIATLKGSGKIRDAGHGYCYIEDIVQYMRRKQASKGKYEPPMKRKGDKPKDVGMDQVGFRARRVTHSNPIFDNGDRY